MAEQEEAIDHGGSEAVYEFYCEMCNEDGLQVEAAGFCTDCSEYLCGQCIIYHKKNRLSRYHRVLDKDNMPKDTPPSSDRVRQDISSMCPKHKGEPLKHYCKSHDVFGCSTCFLSSHRNCEDINTITEVSAGIFDSQEYKNVQQNLASLDQQVRKLIKESRDNLDESDVCFSEAIDSLRRFREEMISLMDDLEKGIQAQIEKLKTDNVEKGKSISSTCTILQGTIYKITSEFESLQSTNRVCQTYIRMKETMTEVKDIERQLTQVRKDNNFKSITFVPNEDLRRMLTGPGGIGLLSTTTTNNTDSSTTTTIEDTSTQVTIPQNVSLSPFEQDSTPMIQAVSASFVQDINVRTSSDKEACRITGSALLSESKLVIVDENNLKIKLVSIPSMKVVSELQVPEWPWDVAVINKNQVAVTHYINKTILILKVTDTITKEREIKVNGKCMGIAYSKNQLIVTYDNPPKLEIMDLQGNVISKIEKDKGGSKLFILPRYVCVSNDGDTLYVSDYIDKRVVSLSRDGDVKAIYTDSNLTKPTKVCLDHRGNVIVCGGASKNIHMLTPACTKIKEIVTQTDGLTNYVSSVSLCQLTDKVYIGMDNYDSVRVYQLS